MKEVVFSYLLVGKVALNKVWAEKWIPLWVGAWPPHNFMVTLLMVLLPHPRVEADPTLFIATLSLPLPPDCGKWSEELTDVHSTMLTKSAYFCGINIKI